MHKISQIEGIGPTYAAKLHDCGIDFQEQFLELCRNRKDRHNLAKRAGISHRLILKWTNHIDLERVKGIGEEYAELLEASGVDTIPELAQRNPHNLYLSLRAANDERHLVRHCPSENAVTSWIEQAKHLPRVVNY